MDKYSNTAILCIIYTCVLLPAVFSAVGEENTNHKHCLQWCVTKNNAKCSEILDCEIHYNEIIPGEFGKPRPTANFLEIKPTCFGHNSSNYSKIGLDISWDINGQYLNDESVTGFYIEIQDHNVHSSVSSLYVRIMPNMTMSFNNYIRFEYFYLGLDIDNAPEVVEKVNYTVALESLPIFFEERSPGEDITPQKIMENLRIPENFRKKNNCTAPDVPFEQEKTTISLTTLAEQNSGMLTIVVTASVIFLILLIVVIVGVVATLFRKEKEVQSTHRAQNILVLLNMGDRTEIGKQTNWMATALSRAKNLGPLTVKYNKWESRLVAEKGIGEWMRESVAWADKVIISSTPDQLRVEENALAFERAFEHTMMTSIIASDEAPKPVFVIHFGEEQYHDKCPFIKDERYKKFYLDEEWQDLCRCITDTATGEKEPLQNGSRQNSEARNMYAMNSRTEKV